MIVRSHDLRHQPHDRPKCNSTPPACSVRYQQHETAKLHLFLSSINQLPRTDQVHHVNYSGHFGASPTAHLYSPRHRLLVILALFALPSAADISSSHYRISLRRPRSRPRANPLRIATNLPAPAAASAHASVSRDAAPCRRGTPRRRRNAGEHDGLRAAVARIDAALQRCGAEQAGAGRAACDGRAAPRECQASARGGCCGAQAQGAR